MIEEIRGASSIFLETTVVIYHIEEHPEFAPLLTEVVEAIDDGAKHGVTSHVTLFEVLSKPFEKGRKDLVERYKSILLRHPHVTIHPLDARVAEEAARLRAEYSLKNAPDAIQLATAKLVGVDVFLTNDRQLRRVQELPVIILEDCLKGPS